MRLLNIIPNALAVFRFECKYVIICESLWQGCDGAHTAKHCQR